MEENQKNNDTDVTSTSLADIPKTFFKGIAKSRISLLGAMAVTVIFPFLVGAVLYDLAFGIPNTYFAGLVYMVLGPGFIGGLVLIIVGLFFSKGKEEVRLFTLAYFRDKLADDSGFDRLRKMIFIGVFLTCINIFVIGVLAYSGYHYMESNAFCGEFCHVPMTPEYTAYQNSAHSRVACVDCHIGSGAKWVAKSKISGARQLYAVVADTFARPIATPVHGLRPASGTCMQCHRPEMFHGDRLRIKDKFLEDEDNTHVQTVLLMKIGSAGDQAAESHGIHWHVDPGNEITYVAADWERSIIPEVMQRTADSGVLVYRDSDAEEQIANASHLQERVMDCIDCHNRPSHVYLDVDEALDKKIIARQIPQELPYVKRQAKAVVTEEYPSQDAARTAIASELRTFYRNNYPEIYREKQYLVDQAIAGTQAAFVENVFPEMQIQWSTYENWLSHDGCFRCHNYQHEAETGELISMDCDTCHTVLAEEEHKPAILKQLLGVN
ncbi:NapC/NirT family cytochrome c [Pelovirga terrestris]|uniref:NapC/NirT family cytochrome c n=1 Tax=Pelovirga terrestris TaxID=2771352 RepID=A0A8J6UKV2_9BACT|nr:NapC/NirT family cytochrome c [Pelovirga terrestris]MBD1400037.1 NapC/NirT family cytochrome c [Pelovirga terrestris]